MTQKELDMDAYYEQMFGRRANGIQTCSFAEWKRMKAAFASAYDKMQRQRIDRQIDMDRGK